MTEKRQGISAHWEESGKGGAVFLPYCASASARKIKINSVCLGADCFAFGELLGKAPQVTKGACSWLGPSSVGIPSLRRRSVGPRRTDIHVLTALSRHPCRSTHCASSAFGLHQSRVLWCLDYRVEDQERKQSKAKQSKAKQSKAKQSKAKQSKAKQSKAKQSKAKQSKSFPAKAGPTNAPHAFSC